MVKKVVETTDSQQTYLETLEKGVEKEQEINSEMTYLEQLDKVSQDLKSHLNNIEEA